MKIRRCSGGIIIMIELCHTFFIVRCEPNSALHQANRFLVTTVYLYSVRPPLDRPLSTLFPTFSSFSTFYILHSTFYIFYIFSALYRITHVISRTPYVESALRFAINWHHFCTKFFCENYQQSRISTNSIFYLR